MLAFALARYPLQMAILLGLVGGLTGGRLSQWWLVRNNPAVSDEKDGGASVPQTLELFTKQLKRLGLQSKEEQKRRRKQPRVGLFGGVRPRR